MRHFRIVSTSLIIGLSLAACAPPDPRRVEEQWTTPVGKPSGKSSNAALAGLALSAGTLTPAFAKGTTWYTTDVVYQTTTTTVTATVADAKASVSLNGAALSSATASEPLPLAVGSTPLELVVTAEDGTTQTYKVTITRLEDATDATLSELFPSGVKPDIDFSPLVREYRVDLPFESQGIAFTPKATRAGATIKSCGSKPLASSGSCELFWPPTPGIYDKVDIVVISPDGKEERTYTVNVRRLSNPVLSDLTVKAHTDSRPLGLEPPYTPNSPPVEGGYGSRVIGETENIEVTATLLDRTCLLRIDGHEVTFDPKSGVGTHTVLLSKYGAVNEIKVTVEASDESKKKNEYTLKVHRPHSAKLKDPVAKADGKGEPLPWSTAGKTHVVTVPSEAKTVTLSLTKFVDPAVSIKKVSYNYGDFTDHLAVGNDGSYTIPLNPMGLYTTVVVVASIRDSGGDTTYYFSIAKE